MKLYLDKPEYKIDKENKTITCSIFAYFDSDDIKSLSRDLFDYYDLTFKAETTINYTKETKSSKKRIALINTKKKIYYRVYKALSRCIKDKQHIVNTLEKTREYVYNLFENKEL